MVRRLTDSASIAWDESAPGQVKATLLSLALLAGGSISWDGGDVSITHSADALAFAGASNGYSFDAPLNISPSAASTARGLNISQTGPTAGTDPQSTIYFNRIDINAAGTYATGEGDIIGLGVSMGLGGANANGQHIALFGQTVLNSQSGTANDLLKVYVGVTGIGQASANDGGSGTDAATAKGYTLGMNAFSILASGATNFLHSTPMEMLTTVRTGASVRHHVGARIVQFFDHAVSGAALDAGLQFINQSGAVGWKDYGIVFDEASDGFGTLFKSTATAIGILGTPTLTHGIDFQTVAFTGAAFRSNGFFVNGGGEVSTPKVIGGLGVASSLTLQSTEGVGTTDFINFKVGNNGAVEAARIVTGGQVIIGHTAAIALNSEAGSAFTPQVQIHATGAGATASITRWSNDANPPRFAMAKSRGAIGTNTIVQASDILGLILFDAADGTNIIPGAYIRAIVDGTPGAADMPTSIEFATSPDGSASPINRLIIRNNGLIQFASASQIANGSVATVLGSLGPTGSHTTVQEWLQIQNASGATRYVPMF